ncbi:SRPBCC family protein [Paracoccus sp. 1_MG-2023]|uniref:SRPBCC family protein n=1 Tax=Paracoccus sp. C2R09 TaxID=2839896 RepID=UPI0020901D1D|nr:SRPBCC family protein [Paracoccus sp. C2R09]MDO6668603.1 SRPBCC family protein [Paracoccus sp. 1_MG-2023]
MLTTWLNTRPELDYQREVSIADTDGTTAPSGFFQMKFSTRIDRHVPAEQLFDAIGDFDALERTLISRGASVMRIDPAKDPGTAKGWQIGFDWRGRPRMMKLVVTRYDRPEALAMQGRSDALDLTVNATVVALNRAKSRLIFELEVRPRNMKARLMLQTAKLGKAQLDKRFERRIGEYLDLMQR